MGLYILWRLFTISIMGLIMRVCVFITTVAVLVFWRLLRMGS